MRTKFKTITMFLLFISVIAANAEQRKSEIGKFYYLHAKKASLANPVNTGQFKYLSFTENQLSVPGYSEDFSWNEDLNEWQHDSNTTYTYDDAGRVTEEIAQEAETDIYISRISYSYDLQGNITEEVSYVMGFDEWTPVSGDRSVYTISAESQINGVIEQTLENGIWVNKTRIEYIFVGGNIPKGLQTYSWNGNDWVLFSKTVNLTWADWETRKLAAYTVQYRKEDTWMNGERFSAQYNGENYISTSETWINGQWVNTERQTYLHSEVLEEIVLENWTESGWEKTEKYVGTFDAYGNPTGMFYSSWYNSAWETEMELFFDMKYNESNDVTEMIVRYRDHEISEPVNISKYNYSSFLHFTTDVPEISILNNLKVFPNPVDNTFNIRFDDSNPANYQVNIVNLAGQTIFSNTYSDTSISINTAGFTAGMYLLNIKTDDGRYYNGKLLKN
ncbi:MAG TPA: T9SS type A sorting domain-containing protein [Draconibacterium sp.]|nr:T9SS type A sorting domain-containing protein [Draconibacterium sp.]HRX11443.1 T9SS type A sorting domain-containing protein [Draconibacterium sp.]